MINEKKIDPNEDFFRERDARISANKSDEHLHFDTAAFMKEVVRTNYILNFSWLGRQVIQLPQDLMAMQEIIWTVKPDFIIETGIAHGGSLVFYASMLELTGKGKVIGIDVDIRQHNRVEIEKHRLFHRIMMIEGSSVSTAVVEQVKTTVAGAKSILVALDSHHTHEHVLKELQFYAPLVSVGSYCVVFDTSLEDIPDETRSRPWGPGNNPKTAVWEYLKSHPEFESDKNIDHRLLITAAPDGYLKRIR